MPAYLKPFPIRECQHTGCTRKAKVALFNSVNAHVGDYCREHGKEAEREMNARGG